MSLQSAASIAGVVRGYLHSYYLLEGRIKELHSLLNEIAMSSYSQSHFERLVEFNEVLQEAKLSEEGERISKASLGHDPRGMLYLALRGLRVEAAQPD